MDVVVVVVEGLEEGAEESCLMKNKLPLNSPI